jgi:uncharacterized repeat protein (TIGR02543 family)
MKRILLLTLFCVGTASAFQWPGGTMSVPYQFRGDEVFAGWVPSSPWGSAAFLRNPVVELRNEDGDVVAEYTATGGLMDWYSGARRNGLATFTAAAGNYTVTAREGRRLIRISGEGYSGFLLSAEVLADPAGAVQPNRAPTVAWNTGVTTVAHGASYTIAAVGRDEDGNLTQVNVWKNGAPFASAGGGNGYDGSAGNPTSDSGPQTVTFTAQAVDGEGARSEVITLTVTIDPPPVVNYTLQVVGGPGGTASGSGSFAAGTSVVVSATPDATHDFAGWSGDASGLTNPVTVTMDRDRTVTANFALKSFALVTSAQTGGSVSAGGSYPFGTVAVVSATASATHYFSGWSGDGGGMNPTVSVLIDRAKFVQALFTAKAAQVITFGAIADQQVGNRLALSAVSSAGLPVSFVLTSGNATLSGNGLVVTGPGSVTVQALQGGDGYTLAAPAVSRTFNAAAAAATVRYRSPSRTKLTGAQRNEGGSYVIGNP